MFKFMRGRNMLWVIAGTVLVTLAGVLLAFNLTTGEKKIERHIEPARSAMQSGWRGRGRRSSASAWLLLSVLSLDAAGGGQVNLGAEALEPEALAAAKKEDTKVDKPG